METIQQSIEKEKFTMATILNTNAENVPFEIIILGLNHIIKHSAEEL